MLIRITDEADQEAIERVRMRDGDRSWADTVRRLVREADAKGEAKPSPPMRAPTPTTSARRRER